MKVAVLGLGFMGSTHVKAWSTVPDAQIVAVMSSDPTKLAGDLTDIGGNLGIEGGRFDFSAVRKYTAINEALADSEVEVADICLPTGLHSSVAIQALRAGKHVLVEKPIALSGAAADLVCRTADQCGRTLMAGQVLRFIPAYKEAVAWLKGAGRLHSAVFRRRCAAPAWNGWLADKRQSGGGVFDLLIHDADFCISVWGMPEAVRAIGYENLAAGVDILHGELYYDGRPAVVIEGGWHHPKAFPFSMDFTLVTEAGAAEWISTSDSALRIYSAEGVSTTVALESLDPFSAELAYFADCVKDRGKPAACPPEQSAQAVKLMEFMLESREHNGEIVRTV